MHMDWMETIRGKATEAAQAAQKVAKMAKIRISIAGEEERIKKAYVELGKLCYEDYLTDTVSGGEAYLPWHQKIDAARQQIQLLREQLAQLKEDGAEEDCDEHDFVLESPIQTEPQEEEAEKNQDDV